MPPPVTSTSKGVVRYVAAAFACPSLLLDLKALELPGFGPAWLQARRSCHGALPRPVVPVALPRGPREEHLQGAPALAAVGLRPQGALPVVDPRAEAQGSALPRGRQSQTGLAGALGAEPVRLHPELHEPPPRHDHSHAQKDIEGTRNSLAGNEQLLLMLREKCSFTDKECEDSCAKKRTKFPLIAKSVDLEMSIKTLTDETQGFQAETSEIQVQ